MKVLGHRVDALTVAYRVKLDPAFVARLREQAEVAREHGRAAFMYEVRVPDDDGDGTMTSNGRHKVGPARLRWADEASRIQRQEKVWGELRFSRADKCWRVTNHGFYRMQVLLNAPGGGALRDCPACKGLAYVNGATCLACDGKGSDEEPGWTLEIIWYAQHLAQWGLEKTLLESAALASNCGEVLETRLRRIDLCADVVGWDVDHGELLDRLVKRPHAEWRKWNASDDEEKDEAFADSAVVPRARARVRRDAQKSDRELANQDADRAAIYGRGAMQKRRVTGLVVGRGPVMCRIYDKRAELERSAERRELEEDRWREKGWDGIEAVTRAEFQLRGVALTEFGIRDPDAVLIPVTRVDTYLDANGRKRRRVVVSGHEVLAREDGTEATVVDRLNDLWHACLNWVRIVVPDPKSPHKAKCRLKDDPRWAILRELRFTDAEPRPIRRHRPRASASCAQALGVSLSQAAAEGRLHSVTENREAYDEDERTKARLRARLVALKVAEAARILEALIEKHDGVVGACVHFAVRSNAARLHKHRGVEGEGGRPLVGDSPPPIVDGPALMLAAG